MKEIVGDLFSQPCNAICITTNGMVKWDGRAVMGAGIALQAAKKWPIISKVLGNTIKTYGTRTELLTARINTLDKGIVHQLQFYDDNSNAWCYNPTPYHIVALPTKWDWRNDSDIELIKTSVQQLIEISNKYNWKRVITSRPGCGLGGLNWTSVKATLEAIPGFDDRFCIITPKKV
jgi:hypothetical protein